jgi:2-keto-4-pentenoate hydratase/2-oxohepta-3-ene-1,7-dioic acid hydratase in catechol pathway
MFKITALIACVSALLSLKSGAVAATGTPTGIGFSRKPPVFMKAGDICEIEIEQVELFAIRWPVKFDRPPSHLFHSLTLCEFDL